MRRLALESRVKEVVLIPPVYKMTSSDGAFSGFSAAKTVEKLDTVNHKKLEGSKGAARCPFDGPSTPRLASRAAPLRMTEYEAGAHRALAPHQLGPPLASAVARPVPRSMR